MARAGNGTWTPGGNGAIELPDPELIASGVPVRVGDDLVLIGPDGSRFVIDGYYRMDPLPVLTAGPYRLPPGAIELAAGDHVAHDGEQLAAAATPRTVSAAAATPRTVSAKAVEDFTNAIAQGRDFGSAVDELAAAQIRQATARGIPLEIAKKAASAFANELALNLGSRMNVGDAIADAERGFAGALKALTATDKPDPLLQALTTGIGLDGALSSVGVSGRRGAEVLGNALNSGEQHGNAIGKGQSADSAHDKAAKSGNPLMDALVSGLGLDKVAALLGDPNAAQRFAEMLQQGMAPEQAMGAAKQAADLAAQAHKAAEAASKGGLESLASGKSGAEGLLGQTQLAQAMKQAGFDPGGTVPVAAQGKGGSSVMEALASGQGVAQMIGGSGKSFDQAFGNALAEGASIAQAQGAADKAVTAGGKVAGDSTLGQIAAGNAGAVSGSRTFEAAVGEALARGTGANTAIGEATTRSTLAQQASQRVETAQPSSNPFSGSSSPFQSSPIASPNSQNATAGTSTGTSSGGTTNTSASFVTQVSQTLQSATDRTISNTLNLLQTQVAQSSTLPTNVVPPPPPPPKSNEPPAAIPNAAPNLNVAPTATLAEDGTLTITYQANDPDGAIADTRVVTQNGTLLPLAGLVATNGAGTLVVAPGAHQFGTGTVTLSVTDGKGATTSRNIDITVTPVNDAPTITGAVSTSMAEDPASNDGITIASLLGTTDSDIENEAVGIAITAADTANGTWQYKHAGSAWTALGTVGESAARVLAPDASVRFLPNLHWNGNTTLTFRPWDQTNGADGNVTLNANLTFGAAATATMVVTPVNDTPTITATAATITRGQSVSLNTFLESADVDANDTPVRNIPAERTYTISTAPADGALYRNSTLLSANSTFTQADIDGGLVTYQHFGGLGVGNDSFTYALSDGVGGTLDNQTFSLTVDASAAPQNLHVYSQTTAQSLTSFSYTNTADINLDRTLFNANPVSSGTYSFSNVYGPATSATLKIAASDIDYVIGERDTVSINGNTLGYLTGANNSGSTTTFPVTSGWIANGTNTVTVSINNLFAATVTSATLTVKTTALTGATFNAFNVVGSTVDGATVYADARAAVHIATSGTYQLTFKIVNGSGQVVTTTTLPTFNGTAGQDLVFNASPSYALSAASGSYKVQASLVRTDDEATHQTIKAQSFSHTQNSGPSIAQPSLLAPQGDGGVGLVIARLGHSESDLNQTVTYSLLDSAGGKFVLVGNELRVATALNFATAAQHVVQVKAIDATGLSVVESFTIAVSSTNQAPTGSDVAVSTAEDTAISAATAFSDLDGDALTYAVAGAAANGTANIAADGAWTYTPSANWSGTDSFQISAADAGHAAVVKTVTVTVDAANDAPTAANATLTATEDTTRLFTVGDFGFADVDSGDTLAKIIVTSAATTTGALESSTDGTTWSAVTVGQEISKDDIASGYLRYVPAANANGAAQASFTYKVNDGVADSAAAYTATIDVAAVNDAPTASLAWSSPAVRLDAGDGTNDSISLTNANDTLNLGTSGTVEMWVQKSAWNTTTDEALINSGIASTSDNAFYLTTHMNVGLHFRYGGESQGGNKYLNYQDSDNWDADSWHHVAATWNRISVDGVPTTELKLYADGQLVDNTDTTTTLAITNLAPDWTIGKQPSWANTQTMDEVSLWNTVRTQAQIQADMNNGLAGSETGLQGYWKLDEATLADATGHDNSGTLSNGTWTTGTYSRTPVYTENATALAFMPTITLADIDSANLTGATITISANYTTGDTLAVTSQNGITGAWNATTHELSLTGTASHAAYKTALESVTFSSTSDNPTANGASRTIAMTVSDGTANSAAATTTLNVVAVNDAPTNLTASVAPTGQPARALHLNGTDNYVGLDSMAALATGTGDYTQEAWIRTSATGMRQEILRYGSEGTAHQGAFFYVDTTGRLRSDTTSTNAAVSTSTVNDGLWHHVAAVHRNGSIQIYIDGVANGTPATIAPNIQAGTVRIGAYVAGNSYFQGDIADVRVWGIARSAAEIAADKSIRLTGSEPGLISNWRLDGDSSNTATAINEVTGGGAGTLTNGATWADSATFTTGTALSVDANTQYVGRLSATDSEGNAITYAVNTGGSPIKGSLTVNADGTFTYIPNANATGADSFTVKATDSASASSTQAVTMTIADKPVVLGGRDGGGAIQVSGGEHMLASMGSGTATNTVTLEATVMLTSAATKHNLMWWGDGTDAATAKRYVLELNTLNAGLANEQKVLSLWASNATRVDANFAFATDTWYNIAATSDGQTVNLYVNGALLGSTTTTLNGFQLANQAQYVGIGADIAPTTFPSTAIIDEVKAWNTARSAADIKADAGRVLTGEETGLQGYWNFDGLTQKVTDLTGKGHDAIATTLPAPLVTSATDKGLRFDGSDDYVTVASSPALNPSSVTVEAWIKADDLSGARGIAMKGGGTDYNYHLQTSNGKIHWAFGANGGTTVDSATTLTAGQWYHVAVTYDGNAATNNAKIYLNGALDAQTTVAAGALRTNDGALTIGAWNNAGSIERDFAGTIADVKVWNTARSATQVASDMNSRAGGAETGLVGNWRLTEGSGASVANTVPGGAAGTVTGATWLDLSPQPVDIPDRAVNLDGTNDYISLPASSINNLAAGTIEAWVQLDSLNDETILAKEHSGVASMAMLTVGTSYPNSNVGTAGKVYYRGIHSGGELVSATTLQTGQWYHLAVTFDGSGATLYVNGVQDATATGNFSLPDDTDANALTAIGAWLGDGGGRYLDGRVADFRVWNVKRNAADISADRNDQLTGSEEGLVGYWRLDEGSGTTAANAVSGGSAGTLTNGAAWAVTGPPVYDATFATDENTTLRGDLKAGDADGSAMTYAKTSDPGHGTLIVNDDGTYTYTPNRNWTGTDSFTVSAGDGTLTTSRTLNLTVNDSVFAAGTLSRPVTEASLSGGKYFAGTNTLALANTVTYEAWIRPLAAPVDYTGIIGTPHNGTGDYDALSLCLGANGKLWLEVWEDASNKVLYEGSTVVAEIANNQPAVWHHVAATWDGATATMFVDGEAETVSVVAGSAVGSVATVSIANNRLVLGTDSSQTKPFTGELDEVKVWNTIRTAAEVRQDKIRVPEGGEPGLVQYYDFEEGSGSTATNQDGSNALTAQGGGSLSWITSQTSALSDANYGLKFDGVDDYASVSGIDFVNKSFSWEFWAYRSSSANPDMVLGQGTDANSGLIVGYRSPEKEFRFSFSNSDTSCSYLDSDSNVNEWAHWAGTYDAATNSRILYKDGIQVAQDTVANYQGSGDLFVGKLGLTDARYFNGTLDEVRIWSDVRTAAEIKDNYTKRLVGNEDNITALWHLDEKEGTGAAAAADATANNRDLTLTNGPTWDDLLTETVDNNTLFQFHTQGSETDGGKFSFALIGANGGSTLGSASIDAATGIVTYAAGAANGSDSVSYQITDAGGATSVGKIDVTVA